MNITVGNVTDVLNNYAPEALQENYDNSGLIVGNLKQKLTGILISLDCLESTIENALLQNCNMVVCHHPIVFTGLKRFTGKSYIERTVIKAIKNDIAIYACHTNLDNIRNGVNDKIADKLGLINRSILSPGKSMLKKLVTFIPNSNASELRSALFQAGAGKIGDYSGCSFNVEGKGTFLPEENSTPFVGEKGKTHEELETRIEVVFPDYLKVKVIQALKKNHPYEEVAFDVFNLDVKNPQVGSGLIGELESEMSFTEFLTFTKTQMKLEVIKYTACHKSGVNKVAVCGGSGSFLLDKAIAQNAQVFITADFKYHQFFDGEQNISIMDIGHYESEQFTMELFSEILKQKFPTFAVHLSNTNTNPVKYYY